MGTNNESVFTVRYVNEDLVEWDARDRRPWECSVTVNFRTAEITASCTHPAYGNVTTLDVYHGRAYEFAISPLRAAAVNDLMDEIRPLAEELAFLYSEEWDGSNYRGAFESSEAEDLFAGIARLCEEAGGVEIIDAADLPHLITVEQIDELAESTGEELVERLRELARELARSVVENFDGDGDVEVVNSSRAAVKAAIAAAEQRGDDALADRIESVADRV